MGDPATPTPADRVEIVVGGQFGGFLVLRRESNFANGKTRWLVRCHCGREFVRSGQEVRRARNLGTSCTSCGQRQHGATTRHSKSPTYSTWLAMKARCTNPKHSRYRAYGGRGITVCERWLESFESFLNDMGERPPGTTIDRIDVNGSYEPSNCRWATPAQQVNNKRPAARRRLSDDSIAEIHVLLATGMPHREIAVRFGVSRSLIGLVKSQMAARKPAP